MIARQTRCPIKLDNPSPNAFMSNAPKKIYFVNTPTAKLMIIMIYDLEFSPLIIKNGNNKLKNKLGRTSKAQPKI